MKDAHFLIDTHTHINHGHPQDSNETADYTARLEYLQKMNRAANIGLMFASTFASVISTEPIEEENEYMYRLSREVEELYQWVVIDPRNKNTFRQADRMLQSDKCVGIKLHPAYHKYRMADYEDEMFSFADEHKAILLIHNEVSSVQYLRFADKHPDVTFIMAHLGSVPDVEAMERSQFGNVWTDTSGVGGTKNRILEYAIEHVGSDRILFGTDTYAAGFERGRVDYALISEEDKANIFYRNAQRLFGRILEKNKK